VKTLLKLLLQAPPLYLRYCRAWLRFWFQASRVTYRKLKLKEAREAERLDRLRQPQNYRFN
jgi:hypothetical protein